MSKFPHISQHQLSFCQFLCSNSRNDGLIKIVTATKNSINLDVFKQTDLYYLRGFINPLVINSSLKLRVSPLFNLSANLISLRP